MSKPSIAGLMLVAGLLVGGTSAQAATYTTLGLPTLNADIRTWTDGATYNPLFPGTQTWNGVPFELAVDNEGDTAFMLGVLDIPVNLSRISTAYTIINSAFGAFGTLMGAVEFFGSNGAYHKVDLVQGTNVRDHFAGSYNNIIDNVTAVPTFDNGNGRARLDMQIHTLPTAFHTEILETIRFTGLDAGSAGQPFIAAATVMPVPEPGVWALMLGGLGLVFGVTRTRRAAA